VTARHAARAARTLLLVILGIAASACGPPAPGWRALWPGEQQRVHSGWRWERGVPARGRSFTADAGDSFRATLLNTGDDAVQVRLAAPSGDVVWALAGRAVSPVEVVLPVDGEYTVEAPAEVVLGAPRVGRPLPSPRLVVVVLVDTLRDDHVTADLTPGLGAAFSSGRRWRAVTANAPWTLPSVTSMFTSRPVLDLTTPAGGLIGVPVGQDTWPGALDRAGLAGLAVVANYTVHAQNGFAQGFATYLVPDGHGSAHPPDAAWVVEEARTWLRARSGEDCFVYLHLMDPHEPYRDHAGGGLEVPPLRPLAHRERDATPAEAAALATLYAGEVRHVDRVLTPFLAGLPPDAGVLLTSDHGESLGEHGCWGHGLSLYQSELAVPLLVRAPGVPAGESPAPVQLLDVAPTILDLAGCPPVPSFAGRSLLTGGTAAPIVSATFSAGPLRWAFRQGDRKLVARMAPQPHLPWDVGHGPTQARPLAPGTFTFDLAADPTETRPGPPGDELLAAAGTAFVSSAGRLAPGLQVVAWDARGPLELEVQASAAPTLTRAWGGGPIQVQVADGRLLLDCSAAGPVCAATFDLAPGGRVRPRAGPTTWVGVAADAWRDPSEVPPPARLEPGTAALWWNPPRERVTTGHDETIERLRALGYLE
jgi:hypothetical protein